MENHLTVIPRAALRIEQLHVWFHDKPVLTDINLQIEPGELVMAVGPSGSGKTTLLRAINRLNEEYPQCRTSGEIELRLESNSYSCSRGDIALTELRQRVGMVFQHPNVLPFSVYKNIALPLSVSLNLSRAEITERVRWALEEVWLWEEVKDRLQENALTLSGGQQQRLCLARVLAMQSSFLLLDEPTASLDFRSTRKIEELFISLKGKYTILAVTHSLGQMRRLADRALVLGDGRITGELHAAQLADQTACQRLLEDIW
jgi:phosphate transport system ATP-binding protein